MLKFFKKSKKNLLFGKNIEKDCSYCRYNSGKDDIICKNYTGDICKQYEYDPLKRTPKSLPPLKQYSTDDFSL